MLQECLQIWYNNIYKFVIDLQLYPTWDSSYFYMNKNQQKQKFEFWETRVAVTEPLGPVHPYWDWQIALQPSASGHVQLSQQQTFQIALA